MAATITQMPSTPGAGPSSNPISRAASTSSQAPTNEPGSDSEEEWLGPFREEIRRNREQQLAELLKQAESEYQRQSNRLAAQRGRGYAPDGLSEAAYQVAKTKLDNAFEVRKQKIPLLLDKEERALIERERNLRKLSLGQLDTEEAQEIIREQDALLKMYQAQAHRSDSTNLSHTETASIPSSSPLQQTWIPPARSISSQKSNASATPSLKLVRRGSDAVPQTSFNLTEDLFPKSSRLDSRSSQSTRYTPWMHDTAFPSSSAIHADPEEMPHSESDDDEEGDIDNTDEEGDSEEEDNIADDDLSFASSFMLSAEHSFDVPSKSPPMNIGRCSTPQYNTRGRSRMTGRTPPSAMTTSYLTNTTRLRQQSQNQSLSRNDSDVQHKRWNPTPSRENIRQPLLMRRPSLIDPAAREQERMLDAERPWVEHENARARKASSGAPGTNASPPAYVLPSSSFGAPSAAAFSQTKRPADGSAKIWKPPENRTSVPTTSNVHAMAGSSGTLNSIHSNVAPVGANSYRRRNDSDTSGGSPARRPSQPQAQSFAQPSLSPKPTLPIDTPSISGSRRSPIPGTDLYTTNPSPPVSTPLPASSTRRSPYGLRPRSPPPSQSPSGASGMSLSRQPTEIVEPAPTRQETRANKLLPRVNSRLRVGQEVPDSEPHSESLETRNFNKHSHRPPSTSALTERLRERDQSTDRELDERGEKAKLAAEERRKRDVELSTRSPSYDSDAVEAQRRLFEEQQSKLREELLEAQRAAQEKVARELREELAAAQRAREAEFAEQKRVLEDQRQREAELRMQKERELAEKEEELSKHKREMAEWLQLREESEIAEQTQQLEALKKREAVLEEQQLLLEQQRRLELEEQRKREEELRQKVEELKRQQRELAEQQRRKEEREKEETRRRQEEEAVLAEQRRKEEALRAQEDALKKKEWEIREREERLARLRKEEELRAKAEELERQRRDLQQREEELARRESEEEERRREREEQSWRERELARHRQQEDDRKKLEDHMSKKLAQEREREAQQEREMIQREERERERREKETLRERERRQREWNEERRRQQDNEQRAKDVEQRKREEADHLVAEDIKDQEELLRFYENRKRGTASFSSSIPNSAAAFSSAAGTFHSGRAASSASSIHSNWSGSTRSSASSASSAAASDFSRASAASSASSAWSSSTRPTTASTGSSGSTRTATGESHKTAPGAWKTTGTGGTAAGSSPSGAGMGSYTNTSPLSEAEWRRRQEENARRQQEQFRKDSLKQEQERAAQAAAAAMASAGGREQMQRAWAIYDSSWTSLKDRPVLYFRSMPWPVLRPPSTPEDLTTNAIGAFVLSPVHSTDKSARDRLKAELLRWHPDRFESKWLPKVDANDKETVRSAAGQVVRGLNELMTRENNNPFG